MDVIGQDGVAPEIVALAVEVMEAVGEDWGESWITQGAGALRGVEVFVELVGELAVVAGFGDVAPRRRIRGEEGLAGAKPVIEEFTRQRIGEAEGEEVGNLWSVLGKSASLARIQPCDTSTTSAPSSPTTAAMNPW